MYTQRPPVAELIARFEQARGCWEMEAIADELGESGDHLAVGPILTRLGEHQVQAQRELAHTLCAALVALDVMCACGECDYALRPRDALAPDVVDVITELGSAFPMRYLIARRA